MEKIAVKQKSAMERAARRKVRFWKVLHAPARLAMWLVFGYKSVLCNPQSTPFLVYANHVTDLDPILVGCSFRERLSFVAGENVARMGILSGIIRRYAEIIERVKGTTDSAAAMQVLRTLKRGIPVCMFAEGNRSFAGRTGYIHPAAAKLAKMARVPLITYRLEGGYMTTPRWSLKMRRGKMSGAAVRIYSAEELKEMSVEEIAAAIDRDLYVDAYAVEPPIAYRGAKLAERLESMLYLCPNCHGVDTLHSKNDRFFCTCGLSMRMNPYGRFEGESLPFSHPGEWDAWQTEQMKKIGTELTVSDGGQSLYRLNLEDHSLTFVTEGEMRLSADGFSLGTFSATLREMDGIGLVQREKLVFGCNGENYVIRSENPRCGRKYYDLYHVLKPNGMNTP